MSLYIGRKNNGKPLLHLTTNTKTEAEMKTGSMFNDTLFHSDIPYISVLEKFVVDKANLTGEDQYGRYTAQMEISPEIANKIQAYLNENYIVLAHKISAGDPRVDARPEMFMVQFQKIGPPPTENQLARPRFFSVTGDTGNPYRWYPWGRNWIHVYHYDGAGNLNTGDFFYQGQGTLSHTQRPRVQSAVNPHIRDITFNKKYGNLWPYVKYTPTGVQEASGAYLHGVVVMFTVLNARFTDKGDLVIGHPIDPPQAGISIDREDIRVGDMVLSDGAAITVDPKTSFDRLKAYADDPTKVGLISPMFMDKFIRHKDTRDLQWYKGDIVATSATAELGIDNTLLMTNNAIKYIKGDKEYTIADATTGFRLAAYTSMQATTMVLPSITQTYAQIKQGCTGRSCLPTLLPGQSVHWDNPGNWVLYEKTIELARIPLPGIMGGARYCRMLLTPTIIQGTTTTVCDGLTSTVVLDINPCRDGYIVPEIKYYDFQYPHQGDYETRIDVATLKITNVRGATMDANGRATSPESWANRCQTIRVDIKGKIDNATRSMVFTANYQLHNYDVSYVEGPNTDFAFRAYVRSLPESTLYTFPEFKISAMFLGAYD